MKKVSVSFQTIVNVEGVGFEGEKPSEERIAAHIQRYFEKRLADDVGRDTWDPTAGVFIVSVSKIETEIKEKRK
jgi:hypothetical protein